jgi:hypothetical protein
MRYRHSVIRFRLGLASPMSLSASPAAANSRMGFARMGFALAFDAEPKCCSRRIGL